MRVLLTGGAGFMGSAVARRLCDDGYDLVVLDALTYAGSLGNLVGLPLTFVHGDVCDPLAVARATEGVELVIHMAAESHVERSLADAAPFVRTNVEGTRVVLNACRDQDLRLIHVSTDEVFGSAPEGVRFTEEAPHTPGNPYAATKSAAEMLVDVWDRCFGVDTSIVRCVNNYGPGQHDEKLIANWIGRLARSEPLLVHGDGSAVRDWLHVSDFADAIARIVKHDGPRRVYHLAGQDHRSTLEIGRLLLSVRPGALQFVPDRPGQDARYAIEDAGTRADLGWAPKVRLEDGLRALLGG